MLETSTVRFLAALMTVGTVVGVLSFARRGTVIGGHLRQFRAENSPPAALQVTWSLINLVPIVYPLAAVAAPEAAYAAMPTFAFEGDVVLQIVGVLVWGVGGLLVIWSGRALGRYMVIRIAVAADHRLVQEGPYARIRHPAYTGITLLLTGMTLLFLSYVLALVTVAAIAIANYRARREERLLSSPEGLGEAYRAYMGRTGRFLPALGSRR